MEKRNYIKPDAKYVLFYSDEDLLALDIKDYANDDPSVDMGEEPSMNEEIVDTPEGWD